MAPRVCSFVCRAQLYPKSMAIPYIHSHNTISTAIPYIHGHTPYPWPYPKSMAISYIQEGNTPEQNVDITPKKKTPASTAGSFQCFSVNSWRVTAQQLWDAALTSASATAEAPQAVLAFGEKQLCSRTQAWSHSFFVFLQTAQFCSGRMWIFPDGPQNSKSTPCPNSCTTLPCRQGTSVCTAPAAHQYFTRKELLWEDFSLADLDS